MRSNIGKKVVVLLVERNKLVGKIMKKIFDAFVRRAPSVDGQNAA